MKLNSTRKKIISSIIAVAMLLISLFGVAPIATSTEAHESSFTSLNEKQSTVLGLATAAVVTSVLVAAVPGDATTPLANSLADLSTGLLLILAIIYLEKNLLTLTGFVTFKFLIPIACILLIIYLFVERKSLKIFAQKLILFGIVIFFAVPISVDISDLIQKTYQASIDETIETALLDAESKGISIESIQKSIEEVEAIGENNESKNEDDSLLDTIKSNASKAVSKIKEGASTIASGISNGVNNAISNAENKFNNFLESIAILIITNCVIPLLVWVFLIWFIKIMFSINLPDYTTTFRRLKKARREIASSIPSHTNSYNNKND